MAGRQQIFAFLEFHIFFLYFCSLENFGTRFYLQSDPVPALSFFVQPKFPSL